ncbi:A disintegrin and metalloproteinase with thrombospondin motifs adt-2-like isoform X2 [Lycorma delicatula]
MLVGSEETEVQYDVVYPKVETKNQYGRRLKRSTVGFAPERLLALDAASLGRKFRLRLIPSRNFLDTNFVVVNRWKNHSVYLPQNIIERDCFYTSLPPNRAAITTCGGMRGLITTSTNEYFLINPLPHHIHKRSVNIPHLIVKKLFPTNYYNNSLINDIRWQQNHKHYETDFKSDNSLSLNLYNINSEPKKDNLNNSLDNNKNILGSIFIDDAQNRQFFKMFNNDDNNTLINSSNLNVKCNISEQSWDVQSDLSDLNLIRDYYGSKCLLLNDKLKSKTLRDKLVKNIDIRRNRRRIKRTVSDSDTPIHVETAVFVDRDLVRHMVNNFPTDTERELVRFVLAMVNAVQLLYHDPSLGHAISFVMKRLEILHADPPGLVRSHDIDRFLGNFCSWQGIENPPGDSDPLHWDHALILTGLDLYVLSKNGKLSSQVVGLAPVAGMCTLTSSCTVNEGRHFESVYVVAHEIGHNLGMRHDGPMADNNCDPASYLMSPTLGSGKITWSPCSRRYLEQFLRTPQSRCLMDHSSPSNQLDHGGNGALPGERFNADQQCMLKYGEGSVHASTQPLPEICRDLHCRRDHYTWTSHPALEGTFCSPDKWCRSGRCVVRGLSALQALDQPVDGGWSGWGHFSDCASGCLHGEGGSLSAGSTGVMFASRQCNNPRPENGGEACAGHDRKYKTCVASQCGNVPRMTIRDFADEICLRTQEVDKDLIGTGLQRISSDAREACTVWCYKRGGGSKSRGWSFPDGTTCRTHRAHKPMFCINGVCQEFTCQYDGKRWEEDVFSLSQEMCPSPPKMLFSRDKRREVAVGTWLPTSECFYNCISPGTGIHIVEKRPCRKCNTTASVQLCQPKTQSCGRTLSPVEHATTVCTKYSQKVRRLSGLGMQLSSTNDDPDRSCRLACQDDSVLHRFYLVNGEDGHFPFGTDCSRGETTKKAFCIGGKCLEFGSDDTPLHDSPNGYSLPRVKRSLDYSNMLNDFMNNELNEIMNKIRSSGIQKRREQVTFSIEWENPVDII